MTLDEEVAARVAEGDPSGATARIVRELGPELFGYLMATARDATLADEAFSIFCELVLKGVARFDGRATVRTWSYVVARSALGRARRNKGPRVVTLTDDVVAHAVAEIRESTAPYRRTDVKDAVAAIRRSLSEPDRELLYLRIDRQLDWLQIAEITAPDDDPRRSSARLRKRFSRLKQELRERAEAAGILER